MARLPLWAQEISTRYASGANNQFILHGNVEDRFLLPDMNTSIAMTKSAAPAAPLGSLLDFLLRGLLGAFDVVLSYDLGNGIRIEKGQQTFAQWPAYKANPTLPREAFPALETLTHYARFAANLDRLGQAAPRVAILIFAADFLAPASPAGVDPHTGALALLLREWSQDSLLHDSSLATFLVVPNLNDLHSLLANNPRAAAFKIPLPTATELSQSLETLAPLYPTALDKFTGNWTQLGAALGGVSLSSLESLLKTRQFLRQAILPADVAALKKALVEADAGGLIEFLSPTRTLDDVFGQDKVKKHLRADIELWRQSELEALPKGYLLCGPVGTGKTFMVECLAGEAGVPVVKIKNFRDRWIGSTEGNLEKIFRLLGALGRCYVFVDEADQSLGKRESGSGDSGISGRVYAMFAEEMSRSTNRGKLIWILATSRPDLIEVDLKRPGRVDVKIPLFPTTTPEESFQLIQNLCRRREMALTSADFEVVKTELPLLMTPGAAEALVVKIFRSYKVEKLSPLEALKSALQGYRPPVDPAILGAQIQLAVSESTELEWVPESLRSSI